MTPKRYVDVERRVFASARASIVLKSVVFASIVILLLSVNGKEPRLPMSVRGIVAALIGVGIGLLALEGYGRTPSRFFGASQKPRDLWLFAILLDVWFTACVATLVLAVYSGVT